MITIENVSKIFGTGNAGVDDVSLSIDTGEFVFLVGHTGSGKTTLLRMLIRDVIPTSGAIMVDELNVTNLPKHQLPHLRKKIGVIFQDLKLLNDRTIYENVLLPMQVAGLEFAEAKSRAEELLEQVGLMEHRDKFPIQLSGGELQRVAIARSLTLAPDILLADEPTGNLDPETAMEIVDLLDAINHHGTTIIMATHNPDIVKKHKKRVVTLQKGKILSDALHGAAKKEKPENHEDTQKGENE